MKKNLKKCLLVLITCILFPVSVNAVKVKFGMNVDMLISNLTTTYTAPNLPSSDYPPQNFSCNPSLGMGVGVKIKIDLWKGLGIDAGVGYSFYGGDADWGGMISEGTPGRRYKDKIKFENFYVPVLVYYQFKIPVVIHIFVPSISTGPVIGFSAGPREIFGKTNTNTLVHWKFGIDLLFKEHIDVSIGYYLPVNNAFTFSAFTSESPNYVPVYNKVNYWSIGLGYIF